jgi:hypothetical protein
MAGAKGVAMPRNLSSDSVAAAVGRPEAIGPAVGRPMCPRCLGVLNRVPRRTLDRLISLLVPVRRYRCCMLACAWEGALRNSRFALGPGDDTRHYDKRIETH